MDILTRAGQSILVVREKMRKLKGAEAKCFRRKNMLSVNAL